MKRIILTFVLTLAYVAGSPERGYSQFPGIKNTPFDPDTWKNVDPTNKNSDVSKAVEGALGGHYEVTLRNPTSNPINYSLNGYKQIALPPGKGIRHSGMGTVEIAFDVGAGTGSVNMYKLGSGRAYYFDYFGNFLDLFEGVPQAKQETRPMIDLADKLSTPKKPNPAPVFRKRTAWVYSGGFFEKENNGRWVESNTHGTFHFVEVARTQSHVDLHDASRGYTVRLTESAAFVKGGKTKKFADFTKILSGTWKN